MGGRIDGVEVRLEGHRQGRGAGKQNPEGNPYYYGECKTVEEYLKALHEKTLEFPFGH